MCTCIYKVYAHTLYVHFSLSAQNIMLIGSLWKSSWLMHLKSCVQRGVHPCGYQSAASAGPGGIWPMQLSLLCNPCEMLQRDHTTFWKSCALRLRNRARALAQGSGWPWPLAVFVQRCCLTLVHCHWESCGWPVRVCKLKLHEIRKVKTGRTESAELVRVSWGLRTKY